MFFVLTCNCFTLLLKKFQDCCIRPIWIFPLVTVILIQVISSIFLIILASKAKESFTTRNKGMMKILNLQAINECSDEYTKIDFTEIDKQIEDSTTLVNLAFSAACIFLISVLVLLICAAYNISTIRGQLKNQMVERRMVYKRDRLEQQVVMREGP